MLRVLSWTKVHTWRAQLDGCVPHCSEQTITQINSSGRLKKNIHHVQKLDNIAKVKIWHALHVPVLQVRYHTPLLLFSIATIVAVVCSTILRKFKVSPPLVSSRLKAALAINYNDVEFPQLFLQTSVTATTTYLLEHIYIQYCMPIL